MSFHTLNHFCLCEGVTKVKLHSPGEAMLNVWQAEGTMPLLLTINRIPLKNNTVQLKKVTQFISGTGEEVRSQVINVIIK